MKTPPRPNRWQRINPSDLVRFLLLFACGWAIIQFIQYFYSVIAVFTTAAVIAALLNYPIQWLARLIPRSLAIALVFIATLVILMGLVAALSLELVTQGQSLLADLVETLETGNILPLTDDWLEENLERLIEVLRTGLTTGLELAQQLFANFFIFIFIIAISVYMVIDGSQIWSVGLNLVPPHLRDRVDFTVKQSFLGFFRGQVLLMAFLSTTSFVVFKVLGVQFALFLAVIVAVLDAIPGIGATLGIGLVTLLIFVSQGVGLAAKTLVASVVLQQVQDNVISPKVMKNTLEINPVLLFFSIFVGEKVAGLLGIFLAIPVAGMLVAWFKTPSAVPVDPASTSDLPKSDP
ncbi:MAG: AI-2E family transporter [Synechococcales bacterium]|nr:AI-2E family transporter [Synechococcales bacterium]